MGCLGFLGAVLVEGELGDCHTTRLLESSPFVADMAVKHTRRAGAFAPQPSSTSYVIVLPVRLWFTRRSTHTRHIARPLWAWVLPLGSAIEMAKLPGLGEGLGREAPSAGSISGVGRAASAGLHTADAECEPIYTRMHSHVADASASVRGRVSDGSRRWLFVADIVPWASGLDTLHRALLVVQPGKHTPSKTGWHSTLACMMDGCFAVSASALQFS